MADASRGATAGWSARGAQATAARGRGARVNAWTAGSGALGARGVRSRGVAGAQPGRWACGLALGCALGALGLIVIRFDSVLFPSQIFWTLFVNPIHEHCSTRNFSKKKIFFFKFI